MNHDIKTVEGTTVTGGGSAKDMPATAGGFSTPDELMAASQLQLTADEESMMRGEAGGHITLTLTLALTLTLMRGEAGGHSKAVGVAMRTIARAAVIYDAPHLLKV